jgi:hypothetical protein
MMFRAVFWVVLPSTIILHGSTTQKTALNIKMMMILKLVNLLFITLNKVVSRQLRIPLLV